MFALLNGVRNFLTTQILKLTQSNPRETSFIDKLFMDGICSRQELRSCYCFSADGTKIVGYDEEKKAIVSIHLTDSSFAKEEYSLCSEEDIFLTKLNWLAMQNSGTNSYAVLLEDANESEQYIRFASILLHDDAGFEVLNIEKYSVGEAIPTEQNPHIDLLRDPFDSQLYFLKSKFYFESTTFTVVKLLFDNCGQIYAADTAEYPVAGYWLAPCIRQGILVCLAAENPAEVCLSLSLVERNAKVEYILRTSKHFSVTPDEKLIVGLAGFLNDKIIYTALRTKHRETLLLASLDLTLKTWNFCFEIGGDHPVSGTFLTSTTSGRIALNGRCKNEECKKRNKWHYYHFSLMTVNPLANNRAMFPLYRLFLSIHQLSFILSNATVDVAYEDSLDESNDVSMFLKLSKEVETVLKLNSESNHETVMIRIFTDARRLEAYSSYFLRQHNVPLNAIEFRLITEETVIDYKQNDFLFVDSAARWSFNDRMDISKGKKVIRLRNNVTDGCEQPRNDAYRWHKLSAVSGMSATTECQPQLARSSSNQRKLHVNKTPARNAKGPLNDSLLMLFDQNYPNWKLVVDADDNCQTICIPPCADVNENAWTQLDRSGRSGRESERKVVNAICKLEIGGVLITGIKSAQFLTNARKLSKEHAKHIDKNYEQFSKLKSPEFEIDALFIHGRYGIFIFETKSSKAGLERARQQLEIVETGIALMYEATAKSKLSDSDVVVMKIAAFPNDIIDRKDDEELTIFDQNDLQPENLSAHFKKNYREGSLVNSLQNFIATLVTCRSVYYISVVHNALKISEILDRQLSAQRMGESNSTRKTNVTYEQDGKPVPLFLTAEQLDALEWNGQFQLISGPPGTGKTIILLLKILKYLEMQGGKFCIINCASKTLQLKYSRLLQDTLGNTCSMISELAFYEKGGNEGALFRDEDFLSDRTVQVIKNIRDHLADAQTVFVLSGNHYPLQIGGIDDWLKQNQLTDLVHHTPLSTVFRGTRKIVDEWSAPYTELIPSVKVGHDICGQEIERYSSASVADILKKLKSDLTALLTIQSTSGGFTRNHVAVICDNILCTMFRSYLASEGIPCGTAEEQVYRPNIVAVDAPVNCLSYEWPIVFFISLSIIGNLDSMRLIACSRAMARLFIFERDFMSVQRAIDRHLSHSDRHLRQMTLRQFLPIIDAARMECRADYFGEETRSDDVVVALIRNDFLPVELRKFDFFQDCETFLEALQCAFRVPVTFRWLTTDPVFRRRLDDLKSRNERLFALTENPVPSLLAKIWENCDDTTIMDRWRIILNSLQLINEYASESDEKERMEDFCSIILKAIDGENAWHSLWRCVRILMSLVLNRMN